MKKYLFLFLVAFIIALFKSNYTRAETIDYKSIYSSGMSDKVNAILKFLQKTYPEITSLEVLGLSHENREIMLLKVGKGKHKIFINGAHHGREMLTSILVLNQAEQLLKSYANDTSLDDINIRNLLNIYTIYFVPLVNPDGVEIAFNKDSSWKGNTKNVDLNKNYPTDNVIDTNMEFFTEPETKALKNLCLSTPFEMTISYHSSGEVIYWWFGQTGESYDLSLKLANFISDITNYSLVPIEYSKDGMGFKDWYIQEFNKPSYTIEIGSVVNNKPLAWWEYDKIYKSNINLPATLSYELLKLNSEFCTVESYEKSFNGLKIFDAKYVSLYDMLTKLNLDFEHDTDTNKINILSSFTSIVLDLKTNSISCGPNKFSKDLPIINYNNEFWINAEYVESLAGFIYFFYS